MSDAVLKMFNNILYAVELNPAFWVARMELGCQVLESFFQGNHLVWNMDSGSQLKSRKKYLQSRLKSKRWTFGFSNGMPQNRGKIQETNYIDIGGQIYLGEPIYRLRAAIPAITVEAGEIIFHKLGDAIQAHWAQVKPYEACGQLDGYKDLLSGRAELLRQQNREDWRFAEGERLRDRLERLGLRLPLINCPPKTPHLHRAQPMELGWLNYWSAETCEYLGFPEPGRDRDVLAHSYRTQSGAWLVKICPEPLDLDRPDHLALFAGLYERLPRLGLREGAIEPPPPFHYPEHTAYIHDGNPRRVAGWLASLLQARGWRAAAEGGQALEAGGVEVGLFPGAEGWTVVKALPGGLLAAPLPGREEPLLVEFCREIRRGGFALDVYSEFEAVLLETDGSGRVSRSGIADFAALPEDVDFEAMDEAGQPPLLEFRLFDLEVETGAGDFDDNGQIARQVHEALAGQNADLCGDKPFAEALSGGLLQDRQGAQLCFSAM